MCLCTCTVHLTSLSCLQLLLLKHRYVSELLICTLSITLNIFGPHFCSLREEKCCSLQQSGCSIHTEPLFHCLQPNSRPIDVILPVSHLASKLRRSTCTSFSTATRAHFRQCLCFCAISSCYRMLSCSFSIRAQCNTGQPLTD